jgi:hypothetical protein
MGAVMAAKKLLCAGVGLEGVAGGDDEVDIAAEKWLWLLDDPDVEVSEEDEDCVIVGMRGGFVS